MRIRQQLARRLFVLRRRVAHGQEDLARQPQGQLGERPDVQQIQLHGRELRPGGLHIEESLLHERLAPGLGRLVDDHVLPLGQEVGERPQFRCPAQELPAGHGLIVLKSAVHDPKLRNIFVRSKNCEIFGGTEFFA